MSGGHREGSPDDGLLPTALHCLIDRPKDRPSAAQLCQSLGQLKTDETYTASKAEDQRDWSSSCD